VGREALGQSVDGARETVQGRGRLGRQAVLPRLSLRRREDPGLGRNLDTAGPGDAAKQQFHDKLPLLTVCTQRRAAMRFVMLDYYVTAITQRDKRSILMLSMK